MKKAILAFTLITLPNLHLNADYSLFGRRTALIAGITASAGAASYAAYRYSPTFQNYIQKFYAWMKPYIFSAQSKALPTVSAPTLIKNNNFAQQLTIRGSSTLKRSTLEALEEALLHAHNIQAIEEKLDKSGSESIRNLKASFKAGTLRGSHKQFKKFDTTKAGLAKIRGQMDIFSKNQESKNNISEAEYALAELFSLMVDKEINNFKISNSLKECRRKYTYTHAVLLKKLDAFFGLLQSKKYQIMIAIRDYRNSLEANAEALELEFAQQQNVTDSKLIKNYKKALVAGKQQEFEAAEAALARNTAQLDIYMQGFAQFVNETNILEIINKSDQSLTQIDILIFQAEYEENLGELEEIFNNALFGKKKK